METKTILAGAAALSAAFFASEFYIRAIINRYSKNAKSVKDERKYLICTAAQCGAFGICCGSLALKIFLDCCEVYNYDGFLSVILFVCIFVVLFFRDRVSDLEKDGRTE